MTFRIKDERSVPAGGVMSRQHVTIDEAAVIAAAQAQGKETVSIVINGRSAEFCGSCGRLVCHPSCPRGGIKPHGDAAPSVTGALIVTPRKRGLKRLLRMGRDDAR